MANNQSQKPPKWVTWTKEYRGGRLSVLDSQILMFLWKWKLATARVLFEALARDQKPNTFNKRLRKLERNKLIEASHDVVSGYITWELADFGFYAIRETLGEVKDHGYKSASRHHDRLVQAFQLGEWIWQEDAQPQLTTDQELLKYPQEKLFHLLPYGQHHRPDGYTMVTKNDKDLIMAIEVELHAKSVARYNTLICWYDLQRQIERVYWLIENPYIFEQIKKAKVEAKEQSQNYHLFVDLEDYLKNGWQASVYNEQSVRLSSLQEQWLTKSVHGVGNLEGIRLAENKMAAFSDHRKFLKISKG